MKHKRIILLLLACLTIILLCYVRAPDRFTNPQFVAENGSILFTQAYQEGIRSLLIPYYVGSYVVYSQSLAILSLYAPIHAIPAVFNFFALLTLLAVAGYIFSERFSFDMHERFLLSIAMVIPPDFSESILSLTHTQWILTLALLLLLVSKEPKSYSGITFDTTLLLLAGLTGPTIGIFLPLFLLRCFINKSSYSLLLFLMVVFLSYNSLIASGAKSEAIQEGYFYWSNPDFIKIVVGRFFHMFMGELLDYQSLLNLPLWNLWTFFIVIIFFEGIFIFYAIKNKNYTVLYIALGGLLILVITLYIFRRTPGIFIPFSNGTRYFYIPTVTFLWVLILSMKQETMACLAKWLLVAVGLAFFTYYKVPPLTDYHWQQASQCIGKETTCVIPINPPGWKIVFGEQMEHVGKEEASNIFYPEFNMTPYVFSTVEHESENSQGVLMVHAPGEMRFRVEPGNHKLTCEFGILAGAYDTTKNQYPTDGVEFGVSLLENAQETVLFKRLLQPLQITEDRGIQKCETAFEVKATGDLILRTHPGTASNTASDWSFWRAVKIY